MKNLIFREDRREFRAYVPLVDNPEFVDSNALRIDVEYSPGGMNYFSGNKNPRGYRVSIRPVSHGDTLESFTLLGPRRKSGGYIMIEESARYNRKRLTEIALLMDDKIPQIADAYIRDDVQELTRLIVNEQAKPVNHIERKERPIEMKPMPQYILDAFAAQGDTSSMKPEGTKVICKIFTPDAQCSWYCTEFNPQTKEFFGFANLGDDECAELGNFSLDEISKLRGRLGLPPEYDRHFGSHTLREVMDFKVR
jgi:hypothetical protein